MRIIAVAGARPHFVKLGTLLPALERAGFDVDVAYVGSREGVRPETILERSARKVEFYGVEVPAPRWFLDAGGGSDASTTGRAMMALEPLFAIQEPDAVLVLGDVNASLAAAVSAAKAGLPVIHLDAGLRCCALDVPEEVNRVLISRVAALHLTPTEEALTNLEDEGVEPERIIFVGNIVAESVLRHLDAIVSLDPSQRWGVGPHGYVLASFHRPENLDDTTRLAAIVQGLSRATLPTVWPISNRLRQLMEEACLSVPVHVHLTDAVRYDEMLALLRDAAVVVTDSSGVQQEACMVGTPCVTVRDSTEQTVTVEVGANRLCAADPGAIGLAISEALAGPRRWHTPKRWDSAVSDRIVRALRRGVTPLG